MIKVLFFASLSERLGIREKDLADQDLPAPTTAAQIWRHVAGDEPMNERVLVAINKEYAKAESEVNDGDEVAFFPPVTGG